MKSTTTYLHFNGNCRTAMAFYRECFGGELEVMAYPNASGKPNTDPKAPVQHSIDCPGRTSAAHGVGLSTGLGHVKSGNNFSVFIDCSSNGEAREVVHSALARWQGHHVPPSDMPHGRFGMCDDSFGTSWILNCAKAG